MENTCLVPTELKMFFQVEGDENIYCIIHSCHFQSAKQSVLSTIWMKEYTDISMNVFNTYKDMTSTTLINGTQPIYRIVDVKSIHAHCLLVPYHQSSCFTLLISNPDTWANEFHSVT